MPFAETRGGDGVESEQALEREWLPADSSRRRNNGTLGQGLELHNSSSKKLVA